MSKKPTEATLKLTDNDIHERPTLVVPATRWAWMLDAAVAHADKQANAKK